MLTTLLIARLQLRCKHCKRRVDRGRLAGIDRLYFNPAFFKRLRRFVGAMRVAPPDLAERLEGLFAAEPRAAIAELERLVGETVAIVEAEMPDVDTSAVRKELGVRRPGN